MLDIDIAKKELIENEYTLVIVKNQNILYTSKERGILPLYKAVTSSCYDLKDASIADKITGKGAALLCAYGMIKSLFTGMISKPALKVLEDSNITAAYRKLVDTIKNRAGDGRCLVEILTNDIKKPEDALIPIKDFLIGIGML